MEESQCEVAGGLERGARYLGVQHSVWVEQGERLWGLLDAPTTVEGSVWRSWIRREWGGLAG